MKRWEDDHGVSAIIATILMVAVTVVLAGVLYVMIIGIGGGSNENLAPLGSWQDVDAINQTSAKLIFGSFSDEVRPIDLKIIIHESGHDNFTEINIQVPLQQQEGNPCTVVGYNSSQISATYTDYAYSTNQVNGGDYILIHGLVPGSYYTVEVFHTPSQSILSMTGDSDTFKMPTE